jgi:branched-chain amino acid transport system ATP-binding protein
MIQESLRHTLDNHLPLLSINHLFAYYSRPDKLALENVSVNVFNKEIVALIGPNGAGKSTVLKAIFQDANISKGEIIFSGRDIVKEEAKALVRMGIGYVCEGRRLFKTMTVDENLDMGGFSIKDKATVHASKTKVYDLFPALHSLKKQTARTLSGGEQQMLAFGRAIMTDPKLILLDEPSLGLAPKVIDQMFVSISRIMEMGVAILLVEQNVKKALEVAHRVYILNLGAVAFSGTPQEIRESDNLKRLYLGE